MADSYEAMALSAHLPNRCIAFTYEDGGPPFAGGIFRIEYVRPATKEDRKRFTTRVADDVCPLCDQAEKGW